MSQPGLWSPTMLRWSASCSAGEAGRGLHLLILAPAGLPRTTAAERWRTLSLQQGQGLITASDGTAIDLGDGVQLVVVHAGAESEGLTLRLNYGNVSFYFDGDGTAGPSERPPY